MEDPGEPNVWITGAGRGAVVAGRALRLWLPKVLPSARPFLALGEARDEGWWSESLRPALTSLRVGLVCLGPGGATDPWSAFEMGALASALAFREQGGRVLVYNLGGARPRGPLSAFSIYAMGEGGTLALVERMARVLGEDPRATELRFYRRYEELEEGLPEGVTEELRPPTAEEVIAEVDAMASTLIRFDDDLKQKEREVVEQLLLNVRSIDDDRAAVGFLIALHGQSGDLSIRRHVSHARQVTEDARVLRILDEALRLLGEG